MDGTENPDSSCDQVPGQALSPQRGKILPWYQAWGQFWLFPLEAYTGVNHLPAKSTLL